MLYLFEVSKGVYMDADKLLWAKSIDPEMGTDAILVDKKGNEIAIKVTTPPLMSRKKTVRMLKRIWKRWDKQMAKITIKEIIKVKRRFYERVKRDLQKD
jgi:dissimilatory sulfite reductase (desulfoviridin) alpha/beta subunit